MALAMLGVAVIREEMLTTVMRKVVVNAQEYPYISPIKPAKGTPNFANGTLFAMGLWSGRPITPS